MGLDDSWLAMVPSVVQSLRTVYGRKRHGNTPHGRTVLANLMADSGSPDSYSSFVVTICLFCLVLEIFACDKWTDNADHYYSWPTHGTQFNSNALKNSNLNFLAHIVYPNSQTRDLITLRKGADGQNSMMHTYYLLRRETL